MQMAKGSTHGAAVIVLPRQRRLSDAEVIRFRALLIRQLRSAGSPADEIAAVLRCSPGHVRRTLRLAASPPDLDADD